MLARWRVVAGCAGRLRCGHDKVGGKLRQLRGEPRRRVMLTLPRSIVSRYRPFVAACLDPANIVAAARNRDAQGHWRWLHRFRVDKVSFDLGQMMSLVGALGGVSLDGAGSPRVDVEFSFD